MKKDINTLVKDIYNLFEEGNKKVPTENDLEEFTTTMKDVLR